MKSKVKAPYSFENSKMLWAEAQTLIAGGSQGTRMPKTDDYPIYFDRCKGCRMWDADGNEFIDLLCSIGPIILGYSYDRVDNAVKNILESSFQSSMNHRIQLELAKLLIEIIPSAERVRFMKTGSEATQAAVRIARYATGRRYVARCGYHGWPDMWQFGSSNPGVDKATWESIVPFKGSAESLDEVMSEKKDQFAAVILCPADTRPFTRENFQNIIDVAHNHGALVIFDEIKSGFRSSLGGVQEIFKVVPDMTTISKGIANGYPLSAVVGKAEYMDNVNKTPTAGTFSVEAMSIAAAIATITEMRENKVADHLNKVGQQLIDGLNQICRSHGVEGPMAYADPVPSMPRFLWRPHTEDFWMSENRYFFGECMKYGLFFTEWHVAFVNYSHKESDINEALDICDIAMRNTKRQFNL